MYNQNYGSPPPLNNPFAQNSASNRFPEVPVPGPSSSDQSSAEYTSWMQPPSAPGYPPPSSGIPTPAHSPSDPYALYNPASYPGYANPNQAPTQQSMPPAFPGNNVAPQSGGSGYGYPQNMHTPTSPTSTAYTPAQHQLQNNPGYIPQFDPFSSIGQGQGQGQGQGWSGTTSPPPSGNIGAPPTSSSSPASKSPTGVAHPREWIRSHKKELESWDTYAWKQLLGAFDGLKESWQKRKAEADDRLTQLQARMQYGYYDLSFQQESSRLQAVGKEAEVNADSIAASVFQMHEVFSSYRQSSDVASKQRVREACNAALSGLPDWPARSF